MSCHSTSGGIVSTSLARAVTGLSEKEVQHVFHALKREAQGMTAPSELDVHEWRARQYDLLTRMKKMSDTRRDKLRDRLFRSRSESVPDGATFHAWRTVEARARQEAALREVTTAVDLDPPGSQSHLYTLGEDGRPTKVWYASYGSNLHRDRFMTYIEGGSPEGSTRVYDGCTDPTPPENDIPIRFAGARPHFALTSRVWRGGIAFIDAQKGESAQGLGRAYEIDITQFDEVVAQENGLPTKWATPVPLDEALQTGRSVIGSGSYETILHIGDYDGAPVLTFTAPFSTREALTKSGHILRTPAGSKTPVRMPVMTNKPSPAYLRMIGGGLRETFGMDEVQQADYLRGCPGGDRWTRQQMVRILRGEEPDPPRAPGPENPRSATGTNAGTGKTTGKATKGAKSSAAAATSPHDDDWDMSKTGYVPVPANGSKGSGWPTSGPSTGKPAASVTAAFSHASGNTDARADEEAVRAADGAVLASLREKGLFPASELARPTGSKTGGRTGSKTDSKTGAQTGTEPGGSGGDVPSARRSQRSPSNRVRTRRNDTGIRNLPNVKTYLSIEEQQQGIARWTHTLGVHTAERDSINRSVTIMTTALHTDPPGPGRDATGRNLIQADARLAEADRLVAQATERLDRAKSQQPARYYARASRTLSQWRDEDQRLLDQQRATETAHDAARAQLNRLRTDPKADTTAIGNQERRTARLASQIREFEQRLQETHEIITGLMPTKK